jgi:hypothetical protein
MMGTDGARAIAKHPVRKGQFDAMESSSAEPQGPPPGSDFPVLPIITPAEQEQDQTRRRSRSGRDPYGGLLYLGVAGLVVVAALVGWFGWSAWSLRSVWRNVYVLHDPSRSEAERVDAAYALAHDPRVNQRQYWDTCLRRPLPPLARYALAESLTAEAVQADPRGFALAVARSTGWPVWLRLLLARPLAYAAAQRVPIPAAPLHELRAKNYDPAINLWTDFALAAAKPSDAEAAAALARAAKGAAPESAFAGMLEEALRADGTERIRRLDEATRWLRTHHTEAAKVWSSWRVEGDHLRPVR